MDFTQINMLTIENCRRSERIMNKKEKIFHSFLINISKILKTLTNIQDNNEKIIYITDIYRLIINNFDIIIEKTQAKCNFIDVAYKKKDQFLVELKNKMEKGEKIKLLYNNYLKVTSIFEKKYLDYIFKFTKNKPTSQINDCPICLENIEKKEIIVTECNHCFHKNCLFKSIIERNTCPICRLNIHI
jgi:hypothetical protein